MQAKMMTTQQIADALGITRVWVHQLIELHGLEVERVNPRLFLIPEREFKRLIRERKRKGLRDGI